MKKSFFLLCLMLANFANAELRKSEIRELERKIIKKEWPSCLDPKSFYDQVYCASKVYSVVDTTLNRQYKKTIKKLTKTQAKLLKKVQLRWIRKRDDRCASVLDDGSISVNLDCAISATVASVYYLQQIDKNYQDFDLLIKEYQNGE